MINGSEDHMICWECDAILRRVKKFKNQILQAHTALLKMFYNMSPKLETLSNLSITTKDYYDLHYEFIEQTYTQTDHYLKPNEYIIPKTVPNLKATSELADIENCPVKIEDFKEEAERTYSDYDNDFDDDTNIFEISKESTSTNDRIDEYKEKQKTTKKKESQNEPKAKKKRNTNNSELSRHGSAKYLKYATVTDTNPKFKTDMLRYFTKEILNLEQIEKYNVKLEQNPCGDRCMECRLDYRADFISILRENLGDIKPDSTTNCLLCRKKLRNFDKLHSHWKNSHLTFCKCNLCGFYCRREKRLKHLNDQHTKVYTCKKCDGEFTSEYHFKLHFKRLHDTFVCHHCDKVSSNRLMMIKHLVLRHKNNRRRRVCKICKKIYSNSRCLMKHITVRHPETYKKVYIEAAYCVECDKQFKSVQQYKVHLASTVRHKPVRQTYPCKECGKIFKIKYSLENHVHQVHMTEKARFKCTICNKICCHKTSLQRHIKDVHLKLPKKKDKFCDICGRGFNVMRTLENHRRTHTGEKPYKCMHCPAAFVQQYPCVFHMRKVHNDMNTYTKASFFK